MKVLIDRSVEDRLQLSEPVAVPHVLEFGNTTHTIYVPGVRLRRNILRSDWLMKQVQALPTITRLSIEGTLGLHSYPELDHEGLLSSANVYLVPKGDLRIGLKISSIETPVERSYFQQTDFRSYMSNETILQFYQFLRDLDFKRMLEKSPQFVSRLPATTRKNLNNIHRFKALYDAAGVKHCRDAFHLWAAETNGLSHFITMDKKFINQMTKTSRITLKTKPITPRDFLTELGIRILDPFPMNPDYIYTATDEILDEQRS